MSEQQSMAGAASTDAMKVKKEKPKDLIIPPKVKLTKAERRAFQEAQRATKGQHPSGRKYSGGKPNDGAATSGDINVNVPSNTSYRSSSHARNERKRLAQQTVEMVESSGNYTTRDGTLVDLSLMLATGIPKTTTYTPDASLQLRDSVKIGRKYDTDFEVRLETTLQGCRRMHKEFKEGGSLGYHIGALNFASAKHPGGGFLRGAIAQEESLALSSALYRFIRKSEMYQANNDDPMSCLYQHYMIISPDCPVFRDDDYSYDFHYIEDPYLVTFLTVPCVNTKEAIKKGVGRSTIEEVISERMDRMFAVAVQHKIDVLVLGSWGCGAFGGNINFVAGEFFRFLTGKYRGAFKKVVFSTTGRSDKEVFDAKLGMQMMTDEKG